MFGKGNQEGLVEIEYPQNQKLFLTPLTQIKKNIFSKRALFN